MKLKEIRIKKGMSQGDVAEKLDCSANVYIRYERARENALVLFRSHKTI